MLSSIIDFLNSIVEKITAIPGLIADKLKLSEHFSNLVSNLLEIPDRVKNGFVSFFDAIYEWFSNVVQNIIELPDKILEVIKKFFIPEDGFIDGQLEKIKAALGRLGIGPYKMNNIFSSSKGIEDVSLTVMGSSGTILRSDIVIKGITFFRPAIRGFIALMLIFYNFNQFCSLIGHQGVSIAGLFGGSNSGGSDQSGEKGGQ